MPKILKMPMPQAPQRTKSDDQAAKVASYTPSPKDDPETAETIARWLRLADEFLNSDVCDAESLPAKSG